MQSARLAKLISYETTSFFQISILMQNYLSLAVRQLKFVEIELLGLRLCSRQDCVLGVFT